MLTHFGVTPYLVFDGDYLPSKAATEHGRAKKREESKRLGLELHRLGKISQAHLELQKAVDVTPEMARQLIEELKFLGVQHVVAPYEADAQLVYLEHKGVIQGILSEDSDLLVFGAKRLLTKLEQYGDCIEISRSDFTSCREISLVGWTDADFRRMAILSGCDYLANINKMGLKTAYRLVRKHKKIETILRMLQFDGQYHVPTGYLEAFQRAELTFLHQRVFCPETNSIVMMTPPGADLKDQDLSFLGAQIEQDVALGVARGDLHPMTKKSIVVRQSVSQLPRSPWTNTRRQPLGTPSDLKPNMSIDAFFKAQRTPLAELDPNSFTPSPSQHRLLQQQSGSWTPRPASVRPNLGRSSASVPQAESVPSTFSAALGTNPSSIPASHPPKKRRLCSDPTDAEKPSPTTGTPIERSPFFAATTSDPSPSLKGSKITKARKTTSFNIWSDNSIEDVMAELPDMSEKQVPPQSSIRETTSDDGDKLKRIPPVLESCVEDPQSISQCSTRSGSTAHSGISACTSATSVADDSEPQRTTARSLDAHVKCDLAGLRKESLYQSEPERCRVHRLEIAKSSAPPTRKPALHGQGNMTPLQRLGTTALKRSYSCNSSLSRLTASRDRPQVQKRSSQTPICRDVSELPPADGVAPSEDVEPVSGSEDAMPSSIEIKGGEPSLAPGTAPIQDDAPVKGSEDAMIPESEAESDEVVSDDGQENNGPDFGRFAFTG
ncbi:MAG: hypothetical protein Q9221_001107 [Calogaya cf. arnoldii]